MADKIRCRECWYCVVTPFKHRPDKDNTKLRCKHYEVLKEDKK